ncbi:hypothetical protein BKA70DRAFT_1427643 [Coprinopsis sp. MPI-PUGE-AT-0042]|nr:hypothetical protein BKA70DRAFT_1427643 [Coprinopsis sp. MPI-PUGE-AT-0042]
MSSSAPSTTAQPPARSSTKASRLVQGSPHHLPLDVVLTKVKSNLRNARQQNQDLARQHKALMEERESLLVKVKAQDSLLGAALREGNSILISPLPKSTTKNSAFKPLPRVDEGEEEEEESYDGSEEYDEEKDSDADILQPVMDLVKTPLAITDVPRNVQPDEVMKHLQSSERARPERFTPVNHPAVVPTQDFFRIPNPSSLS